MKKLYFLLFAFSFLLNHSQILKKFDINGIERKALLYEPSVKSNKIPVVFIFHGHGGNATSASKRMDFQNYYKEALVVFMEGIPGTSGYVTDKEGKLNGWQMFLNQNGNRDILFFDKVLQEISSQYKIDENKIFVVGHSNGSRFVNVLWQERGDKIAGIISVAAQGGMMIWGAKPISFWMSMGKNDPLVPYETQKKSIPIVMKNLGVDPEKFTLQENLKIYKGKENTELVLQEKEGGHEFPRESIPDMVEFFKRNKK